MARGRERCLTATSLKRPREDNVNIKSVRTGTNSSYLHIASNKQAVLGPYSEALLGGRRARGGPLDGGRGYYRWQE